MRYLLINQFALTPFQQGSTRHYSLARKLISLGHDVDIISSNFHYSTKQHFEVESKVECIDGVNFYWIKTCGYQNGVTRLINHISFLFKLMKMLIFKEIKKPDVVIGSSPQPFAALGAWIISQRFNVDFWYEVRDLWPASLVDLNVMSKSNPIYYIFLVIERFLSTKSKRIYCLMPLGNKYFSQFGISEEKVIWAPNFVDFENIPECPQPLTSKNKDFQIAYFGSHTQADGLDFVLQLAKSLEDLNVSFRIVGAGPEKNNLISISREMSLENIVFDEPIPKTEVFFELKSADACIVLALPSKLYQWGISFNKIYDYFSVKKPIIFIGDVAANPIEVSQSGLVIKEFDLKKAEMSLRNFLEKSEEELEKFGLRGYEFARQNYSADIIASKFDL